MVFAAVMLLSLAGCSLFSGKSVVKLGVYSTTTIAGSLGYLAERVRIFRLIKLIEDMHDAVLRNVPAVV